MDEKYDKICTLLDKLTLDALALMQEEILVKLELEKCMSDGENQLAKTRYITGHKNVSQLQLPNEDSLEFEAMAVVHSCEDEKLFGKNSYDLEIKKKAKDDEKSNVQDPIRWFGVLVPQSLHLAQNRFKQALLWAVRATNVQTQLNETCTYITKLHSIKNNLKIENLH